MPVPMISYPEPPRQRCPACRFIGRYCPSNCHLAPHFPPETNDDLEFITERLPGNSVSRYMLTNLSLIYRPIFARAVVDAASGRGNRLSDEARDLLVQALLNEVDRLDHERLYGGLDGIPIVESLTIVFSCFIPDLRPIDEQLPVRRIIQEDVHEEIPWSDDDED